MPIAFITKDPTDFEIEQIRLILSTYQDGTGMLENPSIKASQNKNTGDMVFSSLFSFADVMSPAEFVLTLRNSKDEFSTYLRGKLTPSSKETLQNYDGAELIPPAVKQTVIRLFRQQIKGPDLYKQTIFSNLDTSKITNLLLSETAIGENLLQRNRSLLEDAYPEHLIRHKTTLPGWRDFERAVALALSGKATEGKFIYDVVFEEDGVKYGLSCKMRGELDRVLNKDTRVTIEVSNAAGDFWDYLGTKGITQDNYTDQPTKVGRSVVELVNSWHTDAEKAGFNTAKSCYLVLQYNEDGWYQMFKYPMNTINLNSLSWSVPSKRGNETEKSRRVVGDPVDQSQNQEAIVEWYGLSGAQLKYYPLASRSIWQSKLFRLEPPKNTESGIKAKVATEYPELWKDARANKPNSSQLSYTKNAANILALPPTSD